jgi:hypothetical protein
MQLYVRLRYAPYPAGRQQFDSYLGDAMDYARPQAIDRSASSCCLPSYRFLVLGTRPHTLLHKLVGLHDTVGSVRPQSDNKAVLYSLSYRSARMVCNAAAC